ncbi:DUF885 domain-containing protein [Pedomonas mirosovicensis]|uniref:DUF885 domain-containing protein n=1 Tax=Pedomonas mirosovicensis TaxID=2908641 RepID=UPI0021682661|nr:DUF885 domain-containing protein [Pedomonas mirosovicensis]MCH8684228.1 DUF885 domain-containing protein [Pedomonas mirosovicensis]
MRRILRAAALAAALLTSTAVHGAQTQASADFSKFMEDYWVWTLEELPLQAAMQGYKEYEGRLGSLSIEYMQWRKASFEKFMRRLEAIPDAGLNEEERLNKAILLHSLRDDRDRFGSRHEMILFRPYGAWHSGLADLLASLPFQTKAHYERHIAYLNDFLRVNAEGIATSREALRQGLVQSCAVLNGFEKTIQVHIVKDVSHSAFMKPFARKPSSISEADWAVLKARAEEIVSQKIIPALQELETFYLKEYAPNCRESVSVASLPDGAAYYAALVRVATSTDLTPDDIHQIGLKEVARIRAEMDKVIERSGFKDDRKAFIEMLRTDPRFYAKSPDELVMRARALAKQIDGELPKLFRRLPRLPYTVKPMGADYAEGAPTAYFNPGMLEAGLPGIFEINTSKLDQRPLFELPALTLHEAVPGHHLQISLQQEMEMPEIRRHRIGFTAFTEGWGLYAELLGYEMGLYDDPYAEFGRLSYEMWRACRLVVDTGIHAKGWSKEQAIEYLLENTALSRHNIEAEVNRYIASPGQALAYKIGELKIRELRAKAEKALGEKFDLRAFHDAVLENGSVPLDVLESHINGWIARQQQQAAQKAA